MIRKYFLLAAVFVFALATSRPASAQRLDGVPPTIVGPTEFGEDPVKDDKGYYYVSLSNDEANPHSLRVLLDTVYDPSTVCSWYVELRQWQAGDDPKSCPGDYVASRLYGPLSYAFGLVDVVPELRSWISVDFIYLDPTKFSVGGGRTFRLTAKVYHQDPGSGELWDETVMSEPFHISN